jgi:hypothetical protein
MIWQGYTGSYLHDAADSQAQILTGRGPTWCGALICDPPSAAMKDGAIQLGDIAGTIMMLEIACSRYGCRGRLRVARLIEQHGDMRLPELRYILASDCPRAAAASISERCDVYYPHLDRLGL